MSRDFVVWSATLAVGAGGLTLAEFASHPMVVGIATAVAAPLLIMHVLAVFRLFRTVNDHSKVLEQMREDRREERETFKGVSDTLNKRLGEIADRLAAVPVLSTQVETLEEEIQGLRKWRHERASFDQQAEHTMRQVRDSIKSKDDRDAALTDALKAIGSALHDLAEAKQ